MPQKYPFLRQRRKEKSTSSLTKRIVRDLKSLFISRISEKMLYCTDNLIISGFYQKDTGETMNIFITTLPGLFCLVVGVISILVLRRLLPDRKSADDNFEATSDYTVELLVPSECSIIGQTVSEAARIMGKEQIRRLPVLKDGVIDGMISMADIARRHAGPEVAAAISEISEPFSGIAGAVRTR